MPLELENINNLIADDLDLRNRNWGAIDDALDTKADKTTTVNAKPLSSNVTLTASDIGSTPAGGIAATTVQAAINELDNEKANKAQEAWQSATLQNGATGIVNYTKNDMGIVTLYINVNPVTANVTLFTLPSMYRPSNQVNFYLRGDTAIPVYVTSSGLFRNVSSTATLNGYYSFPTF